MASFNELTRNGQLRQLRRLAETGLDSYPLNNTRLSVLNNVDSPVFRVDAKAIPDSQTNRYILRLYSPQNQTENLIRSMLEWLGFLKDANLGVPTVLFNNAGASIVKVESEKVPYKYNMVIFNWLEGEFRKKKLGVKEFREVGRFMARMHLHSEAFQPSGNFVRPRKDWDWFFGSDSVLDSKLKSNFYKKEELYLFQMLSNEVGEQLDRLGKSPDIFGLIHGDLHQGNYLFKEDTVQAIDFDDCGWGYYLYDMALTIEEGQDRSGLTAEDWANQKGAFISAYQEIKPLPKNYDYLLQMFCILRVVAVVNWVLSWPVIDLKPWGPGYLRYALTRLTEFLEIKS